jgi:penicillin-binding protein 2
MNHTGRRLASVGIAILVLFTTLLVRASLLGTVESKSLTNQGERTLHKVKPVPATRGRILASDGRVLVDNLAVSTVQLDIRKVPTTERTAVLTRLAAVLNIPFSTIESRLVDPRNPRYEPAQIATNVKESTVVYLAEHPELFPFITTDTTWQRVYPFGKLAAHTLGYLGRVNPDDIKRQPSDLHYQPSDLIGRAGIEKSFERELRGVPGEEIVTLDPLGRVLEVESKRVREPIPGKDVRLAIDIDLQRLGEETLLQGLRAARQNVEADHPDRYLKADAGALVVFDVTNGEVVASASYPTYDPSEFVQGLSLKRDAELRSPDRNAPLINRVIEGKYPPGSTFKLFTAVAALQSKLITPRSTYEDTGAFEVEEYRKQNIKWRWKNAGNPPTPFGVITLRDAIRVSSDAFFYRIGYLFHGLGRAHEAGIQDVARKMGFGKFTNIRLPQESRGVVPDRARQLRLHKLFPKKFAPDWPTGATINVAIGQGDVLATPLQIARAYAAFANGGTVLDARIELQVIDRAVADQNAQGRAVSATTSTAPRTTTTASTTTSIVQSSVPPTIAGASSGAVAIATARGTAPGSPTSSPDVAGSSVTVHRPADIASALGLDTPTATTMPPVSLPPQVEGHIDISDADRAAIIGGLNDVVSQRGGTAVGAFEGFPLSRYQVAGKTGTAQKQGKQDYAVFVGFGPMVSPKYAIAVVIEQGGFGRQAGALVRRMFEGIAGLPIGPVRTVTQGGTSER